MWLQTVCIIQLLSQLLLFWSLLLLLLWLYCQCYFYCYDHDYHFMFMTIRILTISPKLSWDSTWTVRTNVRAICIYTHLFVCLFVCLSVCLSVCMFVCLFVCLFLFCSCVYVCTYMHGLLKHADYNKNIASNKWKYHLICVGDEAMAMGAAFRAANLSTAFRVRKVCVCCF